MIGKIRSLPLNRWTLQRFGLSPSKLLARVANSGAPRVFCVSIPKAGTHLLERALCLHPKLYRKLLPTITPKNVTRWGGLEGLLARVRRGQVLVSHLRFEPEYVDLLGRHDTHGIFLVRDPRDIAVSLVDYISKRVDHRVHDLFARREGSKDKLRLAIAGDPEREFPSMGRRLDDFAGWLTSGCLVVRFEDLVGPEGGGDADRQQLAVESIYRYLGMGTDERMIRSIVDRLFSRDSPTFHAGAIGRWRELFDKETGALFNDVIGSRADPYGYELSAEP
ncbi:MAG: hypothetical protein ACRDH6_07045 [Actinomycetota bacterium]